MEGTEEGFALVRRGGDAEGKVVVETSSDGRENQSEFVEGQAAGVGFSLGEEIAQESRRERDGRRVQRVVGEKEFLRLGCGRVHVFEDTPVGIGNRE
jgi:hypothetical protein